MDDKKLRRGYVKFSVVMLDDIEVSAEKKERVYELVQKGMKALAMNTRCRLYPIMQISKPRSK